MSMSSGVAEYTAATPTLLQLLACRQQSLSFLTTVRCAKIYAYNQPVLWCAWSARGAHPGRDAGIGTRVECIGNIPSAYRQCAVHDLESYVLDRTGAHAESCSAA
jgi:hypothetical protein